jgi:hypothetical protein
VADNQRCHEVASHSEALVAPVLAVKFLESSKLSELATLAKLAKLVEPAKESEPAMSLESEELAAKELASAKAADDRH